ncbi:cyclic nucleotide-binding domain-containing protein [Azonexus caeni]|uniref:cyclic nucleotide-binding domain-containing protein n=1 Tax=Azonexus caeni TaxID=266126 RepID=UPI003A847FC3
MTGFIRRKTPASDLYPLARSILFAGLNRSELGIVESMLHTRQYQAGEIVFDEGDDGQALYIVRLGNIAIRTVTAWDTPVAVLGPGNFFGEMALLDQSWRSAQARAQTESTLSALYRGDFERLLDAHSRIASRLTLQLARQMGTRLRGMLEDGGKRSDATRHD